jgi:hypothetical protein
VLAGVGQSIGEWKMSIGSSAPSEWAAAIVVAICEKLKEHQKEPWLYQSGKCLFKLRRCQAHLRNIEAIYADIEAIEPGNFPMKIGVVKGKPIDELFYSHYDGPLAPELFFNVDGFFEASKSCIDFSLDMLGSVTILKNPPNSMNGMIKDLRRHRRQSGDDLADVLLRMWDEGGSSVKAYRDCFTHFVALAGDHWQTAINIKCERGVTHARYFLPDNPSANKNSLFTYNNHVDAREVARELAQSIEQYVKSILILSAGKYGLHGRLSSNAKREYHNVSVGTW